MIAHHGAHHRGARIARRALELGTALKLRSRHNEQFPVGTRVQIVGRQQLEEFRRSWRHHHPLTLEQLAFPGRPAVVRNVAFYHGGDVLYELEGIPAMWHAPCLVSPD